MALQNINIGNIANDGTGDSLRIAFDKVNKNFLDIEARSTVQNTVENLGSGAGVFPRRHPRRDGRLVLRAAHARIDGMGCGAYAEQRARAHVFPGCLLDHGGKARLKSGGRVRKVLDRGPRPT